MHMRWEMDSRTACTSTIAPRADPDCIRKCINLWGGAYGKRISRTEPATAAAYSSGSPVSAGLRCHRLIY